MIFIDHQSQVQNPSHSAQQKPYLPCKNFINHARTCIRFFGYRQPFIGQGCFKPRPSKFLIQHQCISIDQELTCGQFGLLQLLQPITRQMQKVKISLSQHTLAQLCYGGNLNYLSFIFETIEYPSSIAISLPEPVSSSLTPVSTSLMQLCASLFPCNTRISLSLRKSWLNKCPLEILRNVTQQNFGLVSIFSSEKKGN